MRLWENLRFGRIESLDESHETWSGSGALVRGATEVWVHGLGLLFTLTEQISEFEVRILLEFPIEYMFRYFSVFFS